MMRWEKTQVMGMTIYLFRHGETDWNKAKRLQGQSDIPLNAFGRELALKTAEALKGEIGRASCRERV